MDVAAHGAGGLAGDAVAAAGEAAAVAGDVHGLQRPLSEPSAFFARARPLHRHRPAHTQTQRGQS